MTKRAQLSSFLALTLHPERMTLLSIRENTIHGIAEKPLEKSFTLERIKEPGCVEETIDQVKSLLMEVEESSGEIGIALSGSMVMVKRIPVALGLEEDYIRDQLRWEAFQYLLSPLDAYVMSYQRLPVASPTGNPLYVQVLVRKPVIQFLRTVATQCHLSLVDIDVDLFANVRTILANYDVEPKTILVLLDCHLSHLFSIFIHQQEYFLSSKISFPHHSLGEVEDIGEWVKNILKEVRRLIFGHRLGRGIEDIGQVMLMGEGLLSEAIQELKNALPIQVEIVNPFQRIALHDRVSRSHALTHSPELFTAGVGIALKLCPSLVSSQPT